MARIKHQTCYFAGRVSLFALIVSMLCACSGKNTPSDTLYQYYINEQTFAGQGMVYVYAPVGNPELPGEYWHYRLLFDWRGNALKAALYDATGQITQELTERLTKDQARLMSLELMYPTETGVSSVAPEINARAVFPFGKMDSTARAYYQIEYWDTAEDSVRVILSKERTFVERLSYPIEGKELPAVRFEVTETLETETQGFTESTWKGTEIYVQDIGLVYYKKEITDQFVLEYALVERMPFEQFQTSH